MKVKLDEENFDEAEAQAYRCWSEPKVLPRFPSRLPRYAHSSLHTDPIRYHRIICSPPSRIHFAPHHKAILHPPLCTP